MAIVQADTDQMNPRAFQCQQHFLQIPRLLETEIADDIVSARQLLQPGGALRVLNRVGLNAE
ncbi:hypothetical protein D3C78_1953120 [compost metagenome]